MIVDENKVVPVEEITLSQLKLKEVPYLDGILELSSSLRLLDISFNHFSSKCSKCSKE
jgi:hypothetical protein